jgi:arginine/ornithine N-succinyltransferase beta subunit
VFLKQNGQPLGVTSIPADEHELRSRLEAKLAAVE